MYSLMILLATAALAEPVVQVEPGRLNHGMVTDVIDVPIDDVLAIINDCDRADEWFPDLKNSNLLDKHGTMAHCDGHTDLPWPVKDRVWELKTDWHVEVRDGIATTVVPFEYVPGSGNLDAMYGSYRLQSVGPHGEQTLVIYEAWIDLGIWIPDILLNWATQRILPGILTGIQEQHNGRQLLAMR